MIASVCRSRFVTPSSSWRHSPLICSSSEVFNLIAIFLHGDLYCSFCFFSCRFFLFLKNVLLSVLSVAVVDLRGATFASIRPIRRSSCWLFNTGVLLILFVIMLTLCFSWSLIPVLMFLVLMRSYPTFYCSMFSLQLWLSLLSNVSSLWPF